MNIKELKRLSEEMFKGTPRMPVGYLKLKDPNIVELLFQPYEDPKEEPTMGGAWCYLINENKLETRTFLELLDLTYDPPADPDEIDENAVYFDGKKRSAPMIEKIVTPKD